MSTVIKILSNCPFYKRECEECRHWDEEKMECEMAILQDRKIWCLTAFGHKIKNMTVQELINELSKVEDKTIKVNFPYSHGTQENGQSLNVDSVSVFNDCVVIY